MALSVRKRNYVKFKRPPPRKPPVARYGFPETYKPFEAKDYGIYAAKHGIEMSATTRTYSLLDECSHMRFILLVASRG